MATGTPPGTYTLWVQPLAQDTGAALGDALPLTTITLAGENTWTVKENGRLPTPSPSTSTTASPWPV
ncbi:MAG: hypothetical protein R3E31_16880 [Chloroflexota bacterium]